MHYDDDSATQHTVGIPLKTGFRTLWVDETDGALGCSPLGPPSSCALVLSGANQSVSGQVAAQNDDDGEGSKETRFSRLSQHKSVIISLHFDRLTNQDTDAILQLDHRQLNLARESRKHQARIKTKKSQLNSESPVQWSKRSMNQPLNGNRALFLVR